MKNWTQLLNLRSTLVAKFSLAEVKCDNAKNEYYRTDTVSILLSRGAKVKAVTTMEAEEAIGVNSRVQLAEANKLMQQRIQRELMDDSVPIIESFSVRIICSCAFASSSYASRRSV